jgi:hypothetical protein
MDRTLVQCENRREVVDNCRAEGHAVKLESSVVRDGLGGGASIKLDYFINSALAK